MAEKETEWKEREQNTLMQKANENNVKVRREQRNQYRMGTPPTSLIPNILEFSALCTF